MKRILEKYPLFGLGDWNAFFALFLDNIVNIVILSTILIGGFGFPADIVYNRMIPGTALGVFVGDIMYSIMAIRLALKTGRKDITAMPLGLDTPSTIGVAVTILGPSFLVFQGKYDVHTAALYAWYTGMGVMIWMSIVKAITSFLGSSIQRIIPTASLLGSLAGVGIVWLAANHFIDVMNMPVVGLISLGLVIFTLVAGYQLPSKFPGAAAGVLMGTVLFYLFAWMDIFGARAHVISELSVNISWPMVYPEAFSQFFGTSLDYLAVGVPFGLLTIIGGINVTEGARLAGDSYKTRDILLTEAVATFIAGIFGGVSQTTPYIGHSAYKKMGARAGYTLLTGILIGIGGYMGWLGMLVQLIPKAAVAPILIFIGFEIMVLAYAMTPTRHAMAINFALLPSILNFGYIKVKILLEHVLRVQDQLGQMAKDSSPAMKAAIAGLIPLGVQAEYPFLEALGQGYVLTAMVWGAVVAFLIDGRIKSSVAVLFAAGVMSFFGVIHSATPSGEIYLPWKLTPEITIPYDFAVAYISLGGFIYFASFFSQKNSHADSV